MKRVLSILVLAVVMAMTVAGPAQAYTGYASWYDMPGAVTASGDYYESYDYTCAHRTYAFGTYLTVSRGGVSITCVVTDRGPYIYSRDLDVSYAAAADLGLIYSGVGRVDIQYAGRDWWWYYGKQY